MPKLARPIVLKLRFTAKEYRKLQRIIASYVKEAVNYEPGRKRAPEYKHV